MNASDIKQALGEHYSRHKDTLHFGELRIGTGYGPDAEQRLDYWAIESMPSKGLLRTAFEIKVSRGDFLAELKHPSKRKIALLLSNRFYFAAPAGLIRVEELPPEAGLVEFHTEQEDANAAMLAEIRNNTSTTIRHQLLKSQKHLVWRCHAPYRDTPAPSWRFLAAVVRRALREKEDGVLQLINGVE